MIKIVTYQSGYAKAFADLNKEWIEAYFEIEDEDLKVLQNPEGYVLAGGGEIFFALDVPRNLQGADFRSEEFAPLGTVAMVNVSSEAGQPVFELAKMAVAPKAQGEGIGRHLMTACIQFARARCAKEIFLVTNDILLPAMALYEKSGFVRLPAIEDTRYSRGNTEMRLQL